MMKKLVTVGVLVCQAVAFAQTGERCATKLVRAYEPLPLGSVRVEGWLKDRAETLKAGYISHMEEYDQAFKDAWAEHFTEARTPEKSWAFEGGGYWFDGLVRLAYELDDAELKALAAAKFEPVISRLREGNIGFYPFLDASKPEDVEKVRRNMFLLRCCGQYGRGLLAYYEATGDRRALDAFRIAYGGSVEWLNGERSLKGLMTAVEAWRRCGDEKMAANFTAFYNRARWEAERGKWVWCDYLGAPKPGDVSWLKSGIEHYKEWSRWHGVMMCETLLSWGAAGALWTGDRSYLDNSIAWWDALMKTCRQPHGAIVADEHFFPTSAYRSTETCVVAGQLWDAIHFFSITGDGRFADQAERIAFNAAPVCTSRDVKRHVYFQSPNRVTADQPAGREGPTKTGGQYQRVHDPLCCTAALNRLLPVFAQYLWMATPKGGLVATMYAPNTVRAPVAGGKATATIRTTTDYPFRHRVEMAVEMSAPAEFELDLRIPAWSKKAVVKVNGERAVDRNGGGSIITQTRLWKSGDKIEIDFVTDPRLETGVDRGGFGVTGTGVPYASVTYGPLAFALAIPDGADENTPDVNAVWQVALAPKDFHARVIDDGQPLARPFNWAIDASPVKIKVNGVSAKWKHDPKKPLLAAQNVPMDAAVDRVPPPLTLGEDCDVELVPYGCARFRVSMFPAVDRATGKGAFEKVMIKSSTDGAVQPAFFQKSTTGKKPLVVSLHPWSGGYDMPEYLEKDIRASGWNYIRPHFRGYNNTPDACMSAKAIADIDDAIAFAIEHGDVDLKHIYVCGVSGGGMATLATYLRSRFPLALCLAWVPISDLEAWYHESVSRKNKYAGEIEAVTESAPGKLNAADARSRSPLYMVGPVTPGARLEILAGMNDGHNGPVPISQSLWFYNRMVRQFNRPGAAVTESEINALCARRLASNGDLGKVGNRKILFRRDTPECSITVFDGTHEILATAAFARMREYYQAERNR